MRRQRSRRGRWRALAVALCAALGLGLVAAAPPAAQAATVQCQVTYAVSSDWGSGFGTNITIKNLGAAWTSWTLGYSYSGNQTLQSGWNGTWSQTAHNVTVSSLSWNANVATGGTVVPGANFTYNGTNTAPTVFTVNGTVCNGAHTPPAVALTSPTAGASYTAPATIPMAASASASDGATITKVEFYSGTTLACTATTAPYACNWAGVAAGNYSITAKAYDSQGATSVSAPAGVSVASTPSVTVNPASLSVSSVANSPVAVWGQSSSAALESCWTATAPAGATVPSP